MMVLSKFNGYYFLAVRLWKNYRYINLEYFYSLNQEKTKLIPSEEYFYFSTVKGMDFLETNNSKIKSGWSEKKFDTRS